MKRGIRVALSGLLLILGGLVILEILSSLVLRQFYGDADRGFLKRQSLAHFMHMKALDQFSYHPFLGYLLDTESRVDYLIENTVRHDKFRIGLLGGSFAEMFYDSLSKKEALVLLQAELRKKGWDQDIEVYNLAAASARQPRQLMASTLYADDIDFFISFEGWNEINEFHQVCRPKFFPRVIHKYDPDLDTVFKTLSLRIRDVYGAGYYLLESWMGRSALYQAFWYSIERGIFVFYNKSGDWHVDSLNSRAEDCRPNYGSADLKTSVGQMWKKFLLRQHRFMNADGQSRLVTFIQPNQYLVGSKIISEEEKKMFSERTEAYRKDVGQMYRFAIDLINESASKYPNIVDVSMIFKDSSETLYLDSCCHLTEDGFDKLFHRILPILATKLPRKPAHKASSGSI